jgi:hypothetical protein
VGGLDFFASMFEALAVYLSLSLLLRPAPLPRGPLRLSQGTKGLAVTVAFVVGWLVLLSGGGHHSPADDHPATAGSAGGLVTCRCCGSQCSPIGYFAPEAHAAYTALGFDGSPVIRGGVARPTSRRTSPVAGREAATGYCRGLHMEHVRCIRGLIAEAKDGHPNAAGWWHLEWDPAA